MADLDRIATTASTGLRRTIDRLGSLVGVVALVALAIAAATFMTGMWVFDRSTNWIVFGGLLCAVPVGAALTAWLLLRLTARLSSGLVADIRSFLGQPNHASGVLIDHDSGIALGVQANSFRELRDEVRTRRRQLPALYACSRAIASVPGLAVIALVGIVVVGGLGTILLIGGVID